MNKTRALSAEIMPRQVDTSVQESTTFGSTMQSIPKRQNPAVHPLPPPTNSIVNETKKKRSDRLAEKCERASVAWDQAEVGHRGRYSVERVLALREYCGRTSPTRVVAVCLMAPLPALLITLGLDLIPLADPSQGWKANYALWIRSFWQLFFISIGGILQMKAVIIPGTISTKGGIVAAWASSVSFVGFQLFLASSWVFPIPFGNVFTVGVYVSLFLFFTMLAIGPRKLASSRALQQQLKAHLPTMAVEGGLVLIYPTFSALFAHVSGPQQTMLICTLPAVNFVLKNVIARVAAHLDEALATIVVFSVEVFNTLYVAICVQASTSSITIPLIFVADAIPIAMAVRTIFLQMRTTVQPCERIMLTKNTLQDLPEKVLAAFREDRASSRLIRVDAPIPLPVSMESRAILDELNSIRLKKDHLMRLPRLRSSSFTHSARTQSYPAAASHNQKKHQLQAQVPQNSGPVCLGSSVQTSTACSSSDVSPYQQSSITMGRLKSQPQLQPADATRPRASREAEVLRDKLQALFHSEYLALIEFIECVVPLLYAVYLGVLVRLPNAIYYAHTHSLSPSKVSSTLATLAVYGSVEVVSLALLHALLKRRLGFSPLYQVAFVLEAHAATVQGHFVVWIVYCLSLTLQHYGVDFTFKFAWLSAS